MACVWERRWWLQRLVVWPQRARTYLKKALAARHPAWSWRRRALMADADGQALHQCLADDALDEAEAAAQTGQYPRWRRRVDAGWLPGRPGEDTKKRARTRGRTTRLSALTHFAPTFVPGMGRADRACLFGSDHLDGFSPFFCQREHIRTCGVLT
jgi:hypothetical protein